MDSLSIMCLLLILSKLITCIGDVIDYDVITVFSSERTRWVEAINPPVSNKGGETIYEAWGKLQSPNKVV